MRAASWEFKYRALIFGLIFGAGFAAYGFNPRNSVAALSAALGAAWGVDENLLARTLFGLAALLVAAAALVRTWACSYLRAKVVYASEIKTDLLVADGPYRRVRNPLYFGNMLLVIGLAALMNAAGAVLAAALVLIFCYRLIGREETELRATQGESYKRYLRAVPCLWPALRPRVAPGGRSPNWADGFRAEFWMWGYALSTAIFAATLNAQLFLVIMAASVGLIWLISWIFGSGSRSSH